MEFKRIQEGAPEEGGAYPFERIHVSLLYKCCSIIQICINYRPGQASRMVRCFSSFPNELKCDPSDAFLLRPGQVMAIETVFKPLFTGKPTNQYAHHVVMDTFLKMQITRKIKI